MEKYFSTMIEALGRDAHDWARRGRRAHVVKLSDEALEAALRVRRIWPGSFAGLSETNAYLDFAELQRQRRLLIASINSGQMGPALRALRCGAKIQPEDRGDEPHQLKPSFYAAATGDDRADEDFFSGKRDSNAVPRSVFDEKEHLTQTTARGYTALNWAVFFGHLDLVKKLIAKGADAHRLSDGGASVVVAAAYTGRLDIVQYFVDSAGIDPLRADNTGATPLFWAVQQNHVAVVDYLESKGAPREFRDEKGWNTLTEAVRSGNLDRVRESVSTRGSRVDDPGGGGMTPLMVACQGGTSQHLPIAKFLIDSSADLEARSKMGLTPLAVAAFNGQTQIIELLLRERADLETRDDDGQTPLFHAISAQQFGVLVSLVEHGAQVNVLDTAGQTPLIVATRLGQEPVVQYLLEHGADPALWDRERAWSALHYAADDGDVAILETLLTHGQTQIDATVRPGWTALMLAARKGNFEVAKRLLAAGANAAYICGDTLDALRIAHQHRQTEVLALLKEWGSGRPEMKDALERQAARDSNIANKVAVGIRDDNLFDAASRGDVSLIAKLLEQGKSAADTDEHGVSPADIAAAWGHVYAAEMLVKAGAARPNIWTRRRVSDEAEFLTFEAIPIAESDWLRSQLQATTDDLLRNCGALSLRRARLEFYAERFLLAIALPAIPGRCELFALYRPQEDLIFLDWSNGPLYTLNDVEPPRIDTEKNAIDYCKFFFHFVRGRLGRFQWVDRVDQIPWNLETVVPEELLTLCKKAVIPLTVIDRPPGEFVLQGSCIFRNALFQTKIRLLTRSVSRPGDQPDEEERFHAGQVELFDEELLAEELPVLPDVLAGKLG